MASEPSTPSTRAPGAPGIAHFEGRSVVLCVGPGGVGKTTSAAALALAAAETGRRVCVLTIDPSRRLAQALGLDPDEGAGELVEVPTDGDGSLHGLILDTRRVFDDIVRVCANDESAAQLVLGNSIYRATAQRLGGALEYAAAARVQMLHESGQFDLVVLDTPPTANAIQFLEAPRRIQELVDNPATKLLNSSGGRLGAKILGLGAGVLMNVLERMSGADFIRELAQFMAEFADVVREFNRRAGDFDALLQSDETGVVLTTAATDFSVREALEFLLTLDERGLGVDGIVINRFDPLLPDLDGLEPLEAHLAERLGSDEAASTAVRRFEEIYRNAQSQSRHAAFIRDQLRERLGATPLWIANRRDPPPGGLADLRELGTELFS